MVRPVVLLVSIFFIAICEEGLACNPGWKAFNGMCYRTVVFHYDIRMARRYCQVYGGDLAYIDTNQTFNFLTTLENYDMGRFWVKENSTNVVIPAEKPPNLCAIITGEHFMYADCEEKAYFICEVEEQQTVVACPTNWYLYESTCYRAMPEVLPFERAVDSCAILRGKLAILDDIDKEHHVAATIMGQNKTFLVGAQSVDGVFKWKNGKEFQPSCPQCINSNSEGECLGFDSSSEHPIIFTWVHLNCSSMHNYLCEISPFLKPTTTSTTQPTTTLPPLHCPHGYNWKLHEASGYCYWETTYEASRLNWYEARKFCKGYGGDLATYQDARQELLGLGGAKGHYKGLWFGLKRSMDNVFSWVDGSPLNYTNWCYGQPALESTTKYCVVHGAFDSKWELDYCGVRRFFICKAPRTREVTIPDVSNFLKKTPCNFTTFSNRSWYQYEDHCYMASSSHAYSWHMAVNFCRDNDGDLVSVHSFEETDFLISLTTSMNQNKYWIGLSATGMASPYKWSDGTQLDFIYWPEKYNELRDINACVSFNSITGSWSRDHCNLFQSAICKRKLNSSSEAIVQEPTLMLPGYCPQNWYQLGNKCYRVYGKKRAQRANFYEANISCHREGAQLASIHSQEEQDFLTDLLLVADAGGRIGLRKTYGSDTYAWSDGSFIDYTFWLSFMDINFERNKCVELSNANELRKWTASECDSYKAYICQKAKDPTLTKPSAEPFKCSNITGWYELGGVCYGIFEDQESSWLAAQQKCREYGANLLSFRNKFVGPFLQKRITEKDKFIWIGVRQWKQRKYALVNGQALLYTNWLGGQPRKVSSKMDNCVAMNSKSRWIVKSCKEAHNFVCERSPEDFTKEHLNMEEGNSCPNSSYWLDLGGDSCYIIQNDLSLRWSDAMRYCFQHHGTLASFHSEKELSLLLNHLQTGDETDTFLIGLSKRQDGSAAWIDGSPLDFANWDSSPLNWSTQCGSMSIATGLWSGVSCSYSRHPFICSTPRNGDLSLPGELSVKEDIPTKLTVGSIFGIVICLLVIVAIIAVAAYYMCPYTRVHVPVEDTDSL